MYIPGTSMKMPLMVTKIENNTSQISSMDKLINLTGLTRWLSVAPFVRVIPAGITSTMSATDNQSVNYKPIQSQYSTGDGLILNVLGWCQNRLASKGTELFWHCPRTIMMYFRPQTQRTFGLNAIIYQG